MAEKIGRQPSKIWELLAYLYSRVRPSIKLSNSKYLRTTLRWLQTSSHRTSDPFHFCPGMSSQFGGIWSEGPTLLVDANLTPCSPTTKGCFQFHHKSQFHHKCSVRVGSNIQLYFTFPLVTRTTALIQIQALSGKHHIGRSCSTW